MPQFPSCAVRQCGAHQWGQPSSAQLMLPEGWPGTRRIRPSSFGPYSNTPWDRKQHYPHFAEETRVQRGTSSHQEHSACKWQIWD